MGKEPIDISCADKELAKKYAEKYLLDIKQEILSATSNSPSVADEVMEFLEFVNSSLLRLRTKNV